MNLDNKIITWKTTNKAEFPYSTELNGKVFLVRLNDFPAEEMYSLIYDNIVLLNFDDWPEKWKRD